MVGCVFLSISYGGKNTFILLIKIKLSVLINYKTNLFKISKFLESFFKYEINLINIIICTYI